ncbi:amidohydrolase family protein [Collinsella sp. BA40]|uniref:amidohydrolase family protein n=1 Tax=Collinsella sp. BA40 TaxID=2560852 RepID=UPI0011CADED0|nr:amidohydrolase family protein [Collinsella sp. BA40]TXF35499.1 amidohydrolase family protein [Collinsella sp. BA40]
MATQSPRYAFIHANVLDGRPEMQPIPNTTVIVERGSITYVGPDDRAPIPRDAQIIDVDGAYLMPGLINMHVHLCGSGKPVSAGNAGALMKRFDNKLGRAIVRRILKSSAQTQLASGVTTLRGAGDPLMCDIAVRDAINAGNYLGPRIIAPGCGITVPQGHGAGLFASIVTTPREAAAQVQELVARGADVIKLFVTGGVFDAVEPGEPGVLRMQPDIAAAACGAAHSLGLPVMAHVESTEGVRVALEAGVDTIEHGAPMTPQIIELYQRSAHQLHGRPASLTCTISPALPFAKLDPEKTRSTEVQKINGDIVCAGIIQSARQALEAGIPIGLGTDSSCPYVTQYDMWREIAYFANYTGASNAFALHRATLGNAELLGLGHTTGSIEVGKEANIITTQRNPLDDLSALRDVTHVMVRGELADGLRAKHISELDAELDWIIAQPLDSIYTR